MSKTVVMESNRSVEVRDKLAKGGIVCRTVGELKEVIKHLPDDLHLDDERYELVWYNQGMGSEHLSFREPW